jgi:4'-phosphopantetheinyl transferase
MSIYASESAARMVQNFVSRGPEGGRKVPAQGVAGGDVFSKEDAIDVVVTRLHADAEVVHSLAALLSDTERQRAARFVFDRDRYRFIVARARLRQLLAARLDVRPESVELIYGARGKPALARRFSRSGLRFNVSHSNDVAVYAFAFGREVGIDVEAVRAINDTDSIAARLFSQFEIKAYFALDPKDKPAAFFNCWTRKEAFIKALGDGLYYPLDRFDVSLAPGEPVNILRVEDKPGNECGWHLDAFFPAPGYVAAVVTEILERPAVFWPTLSISSAP